jgi:ATP-binding cassette subfamily B (MDR/TAP) protein 1
MDGTVVEQGFWYDLEAEPEYGYEGEEGVGEFREMVEAQRRTGGFLPEKSPLDPSHPEEEVHALLNADADDEQEPIFNLIVNMKHQSLARPALRPLTLGNWMFDVVADLTSTTKPVVPASAVVAARDTKRVSRFVPIAAEAFTGTMGGDGMGTTFKC